LETFKALLASQNEDKDKKAKKEEKVIHHFPG
jgi:hypothetical protein